MATVLTSMVDCAPGNLVTLVTTGFAAGACSLLITSQGALGQTDTTFSGIITSNGIATFIVPDGLKDGVVTITDSGGTTEAAFSLRAISQYVQASEFLGVGSDISDLNPGDLDIILRRASSYADSYIGGTLRQFPWFEQHKWHKRRKFFPWHTPIINIDSVAFVTTNNIKTYFDLGTDVYINKSLKYFELLSYALGNYALLGALQVIGYSAEIVEIQLTAGYARIDYPQRLRDATIYIAESMLAERKRQKMTYGIVSSFGSDEITFDGKPWEMPLAARELLRPYLPRIMR